MTTDLLAGITVLDFGTVGPAARASAILADYGAQVTKVGAVPRSGTVAITPPAFAYSGGRGTRRVQLDLKSDRGRAAAQALAAASDVVIESFRPGVADRLGIGWDELSGRNPGLVYCSTSGYGQDGPASQRAGHDLNYLAVGGFLDCSGRREDGGPALPGATVADIAAGGMQAAMAIMASLIGRGTSGEGRYLDVSIADGVVAMMSLYVDEYLVTGAEPGPGHNVLTGRYAWYGIYRCADGGWISVGAIEPKFYANLLLELGLDAERFGSGQYDDEVQADLRAALTDAFATRSRGDWAGQLGDADCCVAPVMTIPEMTDDPHVEARGLVGRAVHPAATQSEDGELRQLDRIWAGTVRRSAPESLPDASVTDTTELLAAAGWSTADIEAAIAEGAAA
ncbi:MAG: CaiB/BaiF CoA-transferase family protein [Candidatus Microthrix subdominans]